MPETPHSTHPIPGNEKITFTKYHLLSGILQTHKNHTRKEGFKMSFQVKVVNIAFKGTIRIFPAALNVLKKLAGF